VNPYDQFIYGQVTPMLMPGEQVLHTSLMRRQPGLLMQMLLVGGLLLLLMTKTYFVVLTNRRLILIRTSNGFFAPGKENLGVEQYDATQIRSVTTSGFLNNRSMTFHFADGSKQKLRIAPMFGSKVSGTSAFFNQIPPLFASGQYAALAAGAGGAPAQMGYGAPPPQQLGPGGPQQGYGAPQQQQQQQQQQQGYGAPPQQQGYGAPPAPQGFPPGSRVTVLWSDGQRYPAQVVQEQGGQYLVAMPNGAQQWVPAQNVGPG
jgi:hypothetical protein